MGKGYLLNALHPLNQDNALGKETNSSLKGVVSVCLGFYMTKGKKSENSLLPWVKISVYPKKTYMPSMQRNYKSAEKLGMKESRSIHWQIHAVPQL